MFINTPYPEKCQILESLRAGDLRCLRHRARNPIRIKLLDEFFQHKHCPDSDLFVAKSEHLGTFIL